uniref:ChromodomainhelicaseDNAbinding protein 8 putative n=1 Tax=Albugo laibachii Nc14 TaxID=890382 RepID=F0W5H2_9STRA|nr:ChromodomainhelicaseDNAbinding protein 8 putative [Albugo laibachii Nc14]|eukprot:CCA16363.1 ChromodomainhelicaseDNAbinding protein 8 putative [Albugo laibachii Nc14]
MVAITKSQPTQSNNDTEAQESVTSTLLQDSASEPKPAREYSETIAEVDTPTLSSNIQVDMCVNSESCTLTEINEITNEIRSNHAAPSHLPTCETVPPASSTACTLPGCTAESQNSSAEPDTVPEGTEYREDNVTQQDTLVTSEHNRVSQKTDPNCTLQGEETTQPEAHPQESHIPDAPDGLKSESEAIKVEMENTHCEKESLIPDLVAENTVKSKDQDSKPSDGIASIKDESEMSEVAHRKDSDKIIDSNGSKLEQENVKFESEEPIFQESDSVKNEQMDGSKMADHTNASTLTLDTAPEKEMEFEPAESDHETPTSPLVSPPLSQDTDAVSLENFETEDLGQANNESPFSNVSEAILPSNGATNSSCSTSEPFDQTTEMANQLPQDPSTNVSYPGGMAPNLIAMSAPTPIRPLHGDPRYGSHYNTRPAPQDASMHQHKEFYHPSQPPTTYAPMNTVQYPQVSMRNMDNNRMFENQRNAPSFYNPSQDAPPLIQSHMNHQGSVSNGIYDTSRNTSKPLPSIPNQSTSQPAPSVPYSQPQEPSGNPEPMVKPFVFAPHSLRPRKVNEMVYHFADHRALSNLVSISKQIVTSSQTAALAVDMLRGVLTTPAKSLTWFSPETPNEYEILLHKGSVGLCMNMNICMSRVTVTCFRRPAEGIIGPAEASGKIEIGDELVAVDGYKILKADDFTKVVGRLKSLRPVLLRFRRLNWSALSQVSDNMMHDFGQHTSIAGLDNLELFTRGIWHMGVRYIGLNEWAAELHVDGSGVRRLGIYRTEREAALAYNQYIHRVYGSNVMNYMHPAGVVSGHSEGGNPPNQSPNTAPPEQNVMQRARPRVQALFTLDQKDQLRAQIMLFKFTASDGTIPSGMLAKALRSNEHNHLVQDTQDPRKRRRKFAPEPIGPRVVGKRGRKSGSGGRGKGRKKRLSESDDDESGREEGSTMKSAVDTLPKRRSGRNAGKAKMNYAEKEAESDLEASGDEKKKKRIHAGGKESAEEDDRKGPLMDRIIAVRFVKEQTDSPEAVMEFLIKWKDTSYMHVDWLRVADIEAFGHHAIMRMRRHLRKHGRDVEVARENPVVAGKDDIIHFSESYTEIDRILDAKEVEEAAEMSPFRLYHLTMEAHRLNDPELNAGIDGALQLSTVKMKRGVKYLVKWRDLSYVDCSWEWEDKLTDDRKIAAYHRFNHPPIVNGANPAMFSDTRPDPTTWAKYQESPVYNNQNKLRSYQLEGLNWLVFCWYNRRNCILADEMGLGKTVQATSIMEHLRQQEHIRGPFLVIAPLATLGNWKREIETWTTMNCVVYHDSEGGSDIRSFIREQEFYYKQSDMYRRRGIYKFNVLVTSYQTLMADAEFLECIHWRYLVIDEAHKLKNRETKLLQSLMHFTWDACLLMTGTPLQNGVFELWCLLNFIEPEKFPSQQQFYNDYGDLATADQVARLHEQLRPYMLRRVKEDVEKSIPPKEETIIDVELTTLQKKYYRAIFERNRAFLNQGAAGSVANLVNVEMELRKCCNHPFLIRGVEEKECSRLNEIQRSKILVQASGKTVLLDKMLAKFRAEEKKILIFSQFKMMLDVIEDLCHLRGYQIERMDGSVRGNLRQAAIDRFNNPKSDTFAFLLSTRAGGVGINLIAASVVILYDSDWNPQNDLQAVARCHRIGQTKSVNIYRLVTKKTYEAQMFDIASKKLGMHHAVFETGGVRNEFDGEDENASGNMMSLMSLDREKVEMMIRYGAYAIMGEEDEQDPENRAINELDIDQLLSASRTIRYDPTGGDAVETEYGQEKSKAEGPSNGNSALSFSKATFTSETSDSTIDFNDEQFWEKVLGPKPVQVLMTRVQEGWLTAASTDDIKRFLSELRECARAVVHERQRGGSLTDADQIMSILIELKVTGPVRKGVVNVRQVAAEWLETIERPKRRRNQDVESELMYLEFIDGAKEEDAEMDGHRGNRRKHKHGKASKGQKSKSEEEVEQDLEAEDDTSDDEEEEEADQKLARKRKRARPTAPDTTWTATPNASPSVVPHTHKSGLRISLRRKHGSYRVYRIHTKKKRIGKMLKELLSIERAQRAASEKEKPRKPKAKDGIKRVFDEKKHEHRRGQARKEEALNEKESAQASRNEAIDTEVPDEAPRDAKKTSKHVDEEVETKKQPTCDGKSRVDPQEDEEMWCRVCFSDQGFLDDPIVQCERCQVAVHKYCYGIEAVPEGDIPWYCDYCADASTESKEAKYEQCVLCPLSRPVSAFKKTVEGGWAHVVCALWAPGSQFEDAGRMRGIMNTTQAVEQMVGTECVICKRPDGCIQCMRPSCTTQFHPICGQENKTDFDMFMNENGILRAYCSKHPRQKRTEGGV